MNYIIREEVIEKFPTVVLGIIEVRSIDNSKTNPEILNILRSTEPQIKLIFQNINTSEHPNIKCWRDVYSSFGAKPKKYHCSIEAMSKRILEGNHIPDINDIVNLYNYISLKHLISCGGDDADKIKGDVALTLAKGDEKFIEIGQMEIKTPNPGEVIFIDDEDVLGRRWNWRQNDKTKIMKDSKNINLQIEGIYPITKKEIEAASSEMIDLIAKFFNVKSKFYFLDKETTCISID